MTNPLIKFVTSVCVQDAIYWEVEGDDGYGRFTYTPARAIKCRWDYKTSILVGGNADQVVSKAEILVLEDMEEGSFLALGDIEDIDDLSMSNPEKADGAQRILRFIKTPLFRSATEFVRKAYL